MEYLIQFNHDLINGQIKMRNNYVDQTSKKIVDENDVVTDLIEHNQSVAAACLPVAKQIVIFEKKICLQIPKIGDLFVGIVNHQVIRKVTFILTNYLEEFIMEAKLEKVGDLLLWKISELPIILLVIDDYDDINISVQIEINDNYNLQTANHDVFKACFGYFNQSIKQHLINHVVYSIPLLNQQKCLKIICGVLTIMDIAEKNQNAHSF